MSTKKVKVLLIAIMIILQTVLPTLSYAVDTMKLNIQETRPLSDDDGNGETDDEVYELKKNINQQEVTESIFKIYDVDDKDANQGLLYSKALYCLRGGLGFGNAEYIEQLQNNEVTYTNFGDMKANATSIIESYNTNTNSNIDASYTVEDNTFTPYNAILWIADNMYVYGTDAEKNEVQKQFLNEKVNAYNEAYTILNLTEDDIEVAQQLALWYFSNYNDGIYSLSDAVYLGNAITVNDKDMVDVSEDRYKEITYLFEYLKNTAIQNANKYGSENTREIKTDELTLSFDKTVKAEIDEGTGLYYLAGPFKIDQKGGSTGYTAFDAEFTITAIDSEGNKEIVDSTYYYISNSDRTRVSATLKDMINWRENDGKFYIAIRKEYQAISGATFGYEVAELEFNIDYSYKYNESKVSLWMTDSTDDQPVLLVERELLSKEDSSKLSMVDVTGNFGIKLEKYGDEEKLLTGASFTLETLERENIVLTNNNDGTFETGVISILEEGQSFIYELTETVVPEGYMGLNDLVRIKIETGLNEDETKLIVTDAYFVDEAGQKIEQDKLKISINNSGSLITIQIKNTLIRSFDLALRKYITKINDVAVATRKPNIDVSNLNVTELTAEYKHRKDPVEVKTGDKVTYEITIYNEGEISGRATKVVDQLPTGLKFVKVVSGNYELDTYDLGTNKLTLRETANNANLEKYNGELASTTIEIECEVTATVGKTDKVLTNIAWILEEYNAEAGITITNQEGEDRDSEPGTAPSKTADELVTTDIGYTGKDAHTEAELTSTTTYFEGEQDDDDFEKLVIRGRAFDLALRKYITKVNEANVSTREPNIDLTSLNGIGTTAEYKHRKDPVEVKTGDKVTYEITIYNEGEISGRATKVVDQLPTGLKFVKVVSGNYELDTYDLGTNKLTLRETANNANLEKYNGELASTTIEIECEVTATVGKTDKVLTNIAWILEEYNAEAGITITNQEGEDRDSEPGTAPSKTADELVTTDIGYTGRDTHTSQELANKETYFEGMQDDDDFEKLIIKTEEFDLALRKYIKAINSEELANKESRVPQINIASLKNGTSTTATYTHSKTPITVKQGDIIKYTIRVYNEGKLNGFASEITDYIPEGLGYILNYKQNTDNAWIVEDSETEVLPLIGENGLYKKAEDVKNLAVEDFYETETLNDINIVKGKVAIKTSALDDEEIKGYGKTVEETDKWQASVNDAKDGLFYQEIDIVCIVLAENNCQDILRNIAEITEDIALDEKGNEIDIDDRDSTPDNADLDNYEYREENSTYQEDDDDYEPIQLKYFDLALRKFITAVEGEEITSRIPKFYVDEEGNYKYEHTKEPVEVANGDEVTYTIRIFNEGTIAGYAEEIEDDIPEGLIFLPENETNKKYAWKMYREVAEGEEIEDKATVTKNGKTYVETENASEAVIIRTEYLSEANGTITEEGINSNLIKAYNSETMTEGPDYKDVKVVFQVAEKDIPEDNTDRIITNRAHITEDSDDDFDSDPNEWNEGEDDQDVEHIYVKEFDLALFKWVTKTIVKVDGKTTTRETGFKPNTGLTEQEGEEYRDNEEPEPIASVTIDKKKIDKTVVKFVYKIKVVNEGEIAGYATELRDYVPAGLKFVAEDNPLWTDEGENVISTRALETKLLEPGQSEDLEIVFTWINGEDNLGLKTNIAAIVEDYNEKGAEDVDSDPGNENIPEYNEEQEDDDDYALVILVLKTGASNTYIELVLVVLVILVAGIILIKRYVLE